MYLSYNIHRASGWVLLVVATTTCCLFTVNAQLEPQYIPASTADSVTCYPADSLAWRSVPGKMVVHGAPFVKKPTAPVPPAPPMREPGRPLPVDVGVGPAGGFETAPRPPMRLPQQQQQQPFMRPPAGNTRPGPNMNPVVSQQRAIPAVRFLQEGQEHQKVAGAVVDGVGIETPDWMGQGDELTEEDKAAIARESMYANIQIKGLNWVRLMRKRKGGEVGLTLWGMSKAQTSTSLKYSLFNRIHAHSLAWTELTSSRGLTTRYTEGRERRNMGLIGQSLYDLPSLSHSLWEPCLPSFLIHRPSTK